MKEATIKYKSNKTLETLKGLGKRLGFSISENTSSESSEGYYINGVRVVPGDESIDVSELHEVFTGKNLNAAQLRSSEWQRKK